MQKSAHFAKVLLLFVTVIWSIMQENIVRSPLGFSLYSARKAQGKTQAELAHSASLSIPTIRLLETGRGNLSSWFTCLSVLSLVVLGHGLPQGDSIGRQIAILRKSRKLGQRALAEQSDVTHPTLVQIERYNKGRLDTLERILMVLGISAYLVPTNFTNSYYRSSADLQNYARQWRPKPQLKTIEIFSGTKSFSNAAKELGHQTFTVDFDKELEPNLLADVSTLTENDFPYKPDILWCSPPCQGFSVASIGRHWGGGKRGYVLKSETAHQAISMVIHTLRLIDVLQPSWVFIENPRGILRKIPLLQHLLRDTVTYCQYGSEHMKPTDIWSNAFWWSPKPACTPESDCHLPAPRGSKTGIQGIQGARDRGKIPPDLFHEIFAQLDLHSKENVRLAHL